MQENTSKSPEDDIPSEVDWSVNTSLAKFKVKELLDQCRSSIVFVLLQFIANIISYN